MEEISLRNKYLERIEKPKLRLRDFVEVISRSVLTIMVFIMGEILPIEETIKYPFMLQFVGILLLVWSVSPLWNKVTDIFDYKHFLRNNVF